MYRIGVDVGGTNTDSAILDVTALDSPTRGVLASSKSPTTSDITSGIYNVIKDVLAKSNTRRPEVLSVTIGTTHFVNAVVEADERRLSKVAVVRLCGPYTRQIPPFSDFPVRLRKIVDGGVYYVDGGFDIDGKEIQALDAKQIETVTEEIKSAGTTAVAVVGVFSPLDYGCLQEERCKSIMLGLDQNLAITCSRDIGPPGLLERENATILNASILSVAQRVIHGFRRAMMRLSLTCPLYLSQNDGTLTDVESVLEFPIKTFASGPTNSAMGAAFLAGLDKAHAVDKSDSRPQQVIVVDVGGTTTDVCALLPSGFPRQASSFVEVGGVRTVFSMPEVASIGLGGGSRVKQNNSGGKVVVGPDSVGHLITDKALVFGGDVMTATDIIAARGKHQIGNPALVADIPERVVSDTCLEIKRMIQTVIEEMKVLADPPMVVLVGGGSILVQDDLDGIVSCIRPPHHDSANAVGAAIAKVAGEVDTIEILQNQDERQILQKVKANAVDLAIRKGAAKEEVKIVSIDKIPLQYVTNKATRFIVKAVGRLESGAEMTPAPKPETSPKTNAFDLAEEPAEEGVKRLADREIKETPHKPSMNLDIPSYRPHVRDGIWSLSEVDLEFIASGTGVLGTGGGGPSYREYLASLDCLRTKGFGRIRVISPKALKESDLVAFGSWYGAPSVSGERIPAGWEIQNAIDTVNKVLRNTDFQAMVADEIGGGNGLAAFSVGAHYDRPIVDADGMGRAYPSMEHSTIYLNGFPITPCAISDACGNVSVIMEAESNARLEKMLRQIAIELGLGIAISARPLPGPVIRDYTVPNTVSQAWYLGRAIHLARKAKTSYIQAIFETTPGRLLFSGKVVDVRRDVQSGYTMGTCIIAPLSDDEKEQGFGSDMGSDARHLKIPFQNEYLYAAYTDDEGIRETEVICTVPDLISILGQDGEAIGSQELKYGLKVNVIGMPAHPLWTESEMGMKVGGPAYFGLSMPWKSVGKYEMPRSVVDDFDG
ncbi:uncharacterized protein A1O9_11385 [Exophiala aquamarina CBS 119918]|uniref:Hydantoinase/oxoprolinase n=1 Tax=Exophiala aquamarina CBS 119918 TaxID=1182545 RepID=A0A072NZU9_9EURO|nr:uncharacterized protein A1O9_11385 [Exophiala aquamarina CBS 119918]KEF52543.1 hypothetical protein A1O9_11385 [Exophiala aquamarina CBS 119918]